MKNTYILTEFICWLEDQNYDEKTIDKYERYLVRYNDYLWRAYQITINDPAKFNITMIDNYIKILQLTYAPKTINLIIASIRSYMKYCDRMDYCQYDYRRITMIKENDKEALFVNREDYETILARISFNEKDRLTRIRNILLCKFLFECMLRVSEACSIKLNDFNEIGGKVFLQVVGKGKVLRTVSVNNNTYNQILEYVKLRSFESEYLFTSLANNTKWKMLSRNSVAWIVKKYREMCWIHKKITPHSFRHWGATLMVGVNTPLNVVQKILWHKYITTTQRYTHVVNSDLAYYQELAFSS